MAAKKTSKKKTAKKAWEKAMPDSQFQFMKEIISAPSPVGLEGAMTYKVLKPAFEKMMPDSWKIHQFKGHASIALDTHPDAMDMPTVMIVGHADKIRMQVRSIGDDGKIWINTDSFLPSVLVGHEVKLFCQNPKNPGEYRIIEGGTIEALGAIHFADSAIYSGSKGLTKNMIYLDLQMHGEDRKKKLEEMGVKAGDPILLDRPIKRGFAENTFYGAYLDNGLGCFTVAEVAKMLAKKPLKNVRVLFTIATHEEIDRFGATMTAGEMKPDMLIAVDVNHDYDYAPGIGEKRMNSLAMGEGFTITTGSVTSDYLNAIIEQAALETEIPCQRDFGGSDTGTDAMAAAHAGIDCASASVGFPTRNMHTISETAHTGDVLAAIHVIEAALRKMEKMNRGKGIKIDDLKSGHVCLDEVKKA
jgi:endoglucanase